MKFHSPTSAVVRYRLGLLAPVVGVLAAAMLVGAASMVVVEQAQGAAKLPVMPNEASLWQGLGHKD
ncbi:MAG TPA: hypothetical protein V6D02_04290 [Candidatus Obscuribacterales bacterium]